MSIARYLSKLAALIGSDGKVPAAGLASGAAVSNIGYTPANKAGDTITGVLQISNAGFDSALRLTNTGAGGKDWYMFSTNNGFTQGAGKLMAYNSSSGHSHEWAIDEAGRVTMPYQPAFLAGITSTADATIAIGAVIPLNSDPIDVGGNFNTSTYRFTAPVAGVYEFGGGVFFTSSGGISGNMQFGITKNGAFIGSGTGGDAIGCATFDVRQASGGVSLGQAYASIVMSLSAGDYVELRARTQCRIYQGHTYLHGRLVG